MRKNPVRSHQDVDQTLDSNLVALGSNRFLSDTPECLQLRFDAFMQRGIDNGGYVLLNIAGIHSDVRAAALQLELRIPCSLAGTKVMKTGLFCIPKVLKNHDAVIRNNSRAVLTECAVYSLYTMCVHLEVMHMTGKRSSCHR